jgi:hypothetical protein
MNFERTINMTWQPLAEGSAVDHYIYYSVDSLK